MFAALKNLFKGMAARDSFFEEFVAGRVSAFAFGEQRAAEFVPVRTKGGILLFRTEEEANCWEDAVNVSSIPTMNVTLKKVTHMDLAPYRPTHGQYMLFGSSSTPSASASRSVPRDTPGGE
jgi:hypothetical protein